MPPATIQAELAAGDGYAHRTYAESLEECGVARELPGCGGWLLKRALPKGAGFDGTGCYPLFCCRNWRGLAEDLESLEHELVCVSFVTDPFAGIRSSELQAAFPDVCYSFKQHLVSDLSLPLESTLPSHHRRNLRKALNSVEVRESTLSEELLPHWLPLYDNLVRRHGIEGIARFSPQSFARQMNVPGFVAFTAFADKVPCGMTLWYVCGDVAYYHLAAYSDEGYARRASYALFSMSLAHFASSGLRWAALGAGAGTNESESGLTRFKQGWASETRPVYFCGRILQLDAYQRLAAECPASTGYFPIYRRR